MIDHAKDSTCASPIMTLTMKFWGEKKSLPINTTSFHIQHIKTIQNSWSEEHTKHKKYHNEALPSQIRYECVKSYNLFFFAYTQITFTHQAFEVKHNTVDNK